MADEAALVEAWKAEGNSHFQAQRFDEAAELYSKAIALDATNHVLYSNRAAALLSRPRVADWEAALSDGQRAAELSPSWPKGHLRVSAALRKLGRPGHAEKALADALAGPCAGDGVLAAALQDLRRQEDGDQSPLRGSAEAEMTALQSHMGMRMASFMADVDEVFRAAYVGEMAVFMRLFDPPRHAHLRTLSLRLPLTTLIVCGAQRTLPPAGAGAAPLQHAALLEAVLARGWCRADARDAAGYTALVHAASHHPRLELARVLRAHGADPSARDRMGSCALAGAILAQEVEAVEWLIGEGADPNSTDLKGVSPQRLAMFNPSVQALLQGARHQENAALLPGGPCRSCGRAGATRRCTACRIALYCDRNCQRAHWKAHKKECASGGSADAAGDGGAAGEHFLRVKIMGAQGMHMMLLPTSSFGDQIAHATGLRSGAAPDLAASAVRFTEDMVQAAADRNMLVKVQVPMDARGNNKLLVYNRQRSFQGFIDGSSGAGRRLAEVVRAQGVSGVKAYFVAFMEKQGELTLVADKVLPAQPW